MVRYLTFCLALFLSACGGETHQFDHLTLIDPVLRKTPPGTPVSAGYLQIKNTGHQDDRLIAVESHLAQTLEIHTVVEKDGVMAMRPLPNGLTIKAGETTALKPGGEHIMLIGLTQDLGSLKTGNITLHFEHAGKITVPFSISDISHKHNKKH